MRCSRSSSQPLANSASYLRDQIARRLVRRVAGAERDPGQPRRSRLVGDMVGEIADRLVDQIGGQVIAGREGARRIDRRVVAHQLRRVLVGLGIHEAVEAVEAAAERPAVERPGRARLGQRRDVPFAQHVVAIAVRPQHLGQRPGLLARSCRDSRDSPCRNWRGSRRRPNDDCGRSAAPRAWSSTSPWCGSRCSAGRGRRWRRSSASRSASRSSRNRRSRHRRTARRGCSARPFGRLGAAGQYGWDSPTVLPILAAIVVSSSFPSCPILGPSNQLVTPYGSG